MKNWCNFLLRIFSVRALHLALILYWYAWQVYFPLKLAWILDLKWRSRWGNHVCCVWLIRRKLQVTRTFDFDYDSIIFIEQASKMDRYKTERWNDRQQKPIWHWNLKWVFLSRWIFIRSVDHDTAMHTNKTALKILI